jgi:hypothetical protein
MRVQGGEAERIVSVVIRVAFRVSSQQQAKGKVDGFAQVAAPARHPSG